MLRKNVAGQFIYFSGVNATTGAALTGATFSVRRCIDGTFAAGGGTITEDTGLGFYKCALTQADTNGNDLAFFFTATNAIPVCINVLTTAADPSDSVRLGLTALPNAAAEAAGGLYTRGTGAGQIAQDANGNIRANVDTIKTQAVTCATGVTVLASVGTASTSTAQTGDAYARLGAPAGASVSADVAAINAKTTNLPAAPASTTNITAGTITTVTNLTNLPTIPANWLTAAGMDATASAEIADAVWDEAIAGHLGAGSTGNALNAAGSAGDPWTTPLPGAYGAGTAGYIIGTNLDGLISAIPSATANADALLGRNVSGGSSTGRTVKQAFHFIRNKWVVSGGTLTVYDTDDTTSSWTSAVTGTAGADPITGTDPA